MTQSISFVTTTQTPVLIKNRYGFRPDRKHHWLQRLAISMLQRLGCEFIGESFVYERFVVSSDTIVQHIYEQNAELFRYYHLKGERLLIGSEEFHDFIGKELSPRYMSFSVPYTWCTPGGEPYLYGLRVTVVPWMKGVLVLPKEEAYQ